MRNAGGALTPELRKRFLGVRSALIERGVFDPILIRFDTITVPRASIEEVAEELAAVASIL